MAAGAGLSAVGLKAQAVVAAGPAVSNLLSSPKYLKHFTCFPRMEGSGCAL